MSELKLQQCRLDGRYDVLDCLGRGSYSEVYVARDSAASNGSPQMVVIKALNTHLQGVPDPDLERTLIENFRNEAVALDRVRHPHIIYRLGHGTAIDLQGRTFHYLVLEYLPGGDMQALCRSRLLTFDGALFYLEQTCAGLAHAHSRGIIHRDIKPQNLLLTADQHTLKIADFGVAKIEAAEGLITRVGTDVYAAPEHHPLMTTGPLDTASLTRRVTQLTPAADVYSLAKTAYMLLSGESPRKFSQRPITTLPDTVASKPWAEGVLKVLERATRTNPDKRHQTVAEFWKDLRSATRVQSVPSQTERPADPSTAESNSKARTEASVSPPPAPTFDRERPSRNESARHRIVVPISERAPVETAAREEASSEGSYEEPWDSGGPRASRARSLLVALLLLLAFSGMLYATYRYVNSRNRAATGSQTPSGGAAVVVGRELRAITDVNLRSGPSSGAPKVGRIEKDSRVRVEETSGKWYRVVVVERGREKAEPESSDEGWAHGSFLKAL